MGQTLDNVVAFNPDRVARQGRRKLSAESTGVINSCRDMALTRMCTALGEAFDKIEDELFEMASNAAERDTQNLYLEARGQAREKRRDIEAAFRNQFVQFFEKKVTGGEEGEAKKGSTGRFNFEQLSLVADDTLDENIAVNDIAKRLTDKCDEELRALSQRMGFLLSEPEMADEANPIAPDTIVRALKAACDQMTAGFQTKLTVLKLVEQHMAQDMLKVYRDINTHLVAHKILPTIRPTFRKAQTHIVRKPGAAAGTTAATSATASEGAVAAGSAGNAGATTDFAAGMGDIPPLWASMPQGQMPGNTAAEIFHTLQQLMAGSTQFNFSAPAEYTSVTTGSFAPVPPSTLSAASSAAVSSAGASSAGLTTDALIASLSQLQHQLFSEASSTLHAMEASRNFVPGLTPVADLNMLREMKSQGLVKGSNQIDAMTIDIVALLFDYVFDDRAIPDTIKALIARLQIPVLKVAIIDKTFFSKKNHPVRRLLDILADASLAFAGEASREDPLYKKIENIVDRIHNEFETDIGFIDSMIGEFEQFLRDRETANAEVVEQSARAMHEREKREMARLIAQSETDQRAESHDLPQPVANMLRGPWARVLERVYLRDGGRNARFQEALDTADQLVWSVAPKADASARRDLVAALPVMLRRLQDGMDIAAVEKTERDRFFAVLVDCHAAAVKAGLRGESVAAMFAATHKDDAVAPLFEKLIAEERAREAAAAAINRSGVARIQFTEQGVEIEEVVAAADGATSTTTSIASGNAAPSTDNAPAEFDLITTIEPLKRGTWVEFLHNGTDKIRAKLSWVSPLKGVYLFTNPGATEALSISPDALHQQLQSGAARIIEGSSLIERAVDRMVSSLSGAAA
jgi:Protein of unknown function (DUF1631)